MRPLSRGRLTCRPGAPDALYRALHGLVPGSWAARRRWAGRPRRWRWRWRCAGAGSCSRVLGASSAGAAASAWQSAAQHALPTFKKSLRI